MMKFLTALTCASLLTCGLTAQISGSINKSAPKVTNAIEMGSNKLQVDYTSIRFGDGAWQKIKDDASGHEQFNKFAEGKPIGRVKTTCDIQAAGKKVPAGDYAMFFTVHEQAGWILNLKPAEGEAIRWRLVLSQADDKSGCLKISLEPAAKNDTCSLSIVFGDMQVTVPVTVVPAEKK
ncbi:MAG TPA: hypothetical protein VFZ65_21890 [Planctomycetota bacterium]|nr:hypothetical protein [Planctomycetota bacterium]